VEWTGAHERLLLNKYKLRKEGWVMAVVRWNPGFFGWHRDPFAEMGRLRSEMDKLFDAFAGRRGIAPAVGVFPALNVSEDGNNISTFLRGL